MSTRSLRSLFLLAGAALVFLAAPAVFGHIRIAPTESNYGAREKYTMRVPNEKQSATIRVEGEFPAGLEVYDFEFKPGWKIDFRKDDKGKIIGAVWTGRIQPYEFVEFGMLAINPKQGDAKMLWKFHQYYEDGTREDFTAPPDAQMPLRPMPLVTLKAAVSQTTAAPQPAAAAPSDLAAAALGDAALVTRGKERFNAYKCYECHGMNGEGTDDAPDLIHTRLAADGIAKFLQNPSADASAKGMPDIPATSPDLQPLVAYVMSLKR